MEIVSFDGPAARPMEAFGSVGVTAQVLFQGDAAVVTVLRVAAGGEIGRHPAPVDQLLVVTRGRGAVRAGDGDWQSVRAGQAVVWRSGEEHTTRADEDIEAVVVEVAASRSAHG
ncbi:cupin domain-containing protein [Nucisporomicrobium flavum]|uniref:cupin domain-containing protein n=2 Tax=Nucisporomicrobium flavum TaxID=2785915 RepID=UPI0018F54FCB|nr:cupin domain-containing protein [Nucisporomicrobium flavum]